VETTEIAESVTIKDRWRRIQTRLRTELGEDVFTSWFGRVELDSYDGRVVQVSVPTKFLRNWLQSHYSEKLMSCCTTELNGANRLEFRVRQPCAATAPAARPAERPEPKTDAPRPQVPFAE
jgi:chromosomal replication initiator protein